jgi:hypothetical protein
VSKRYQVFVSSTYVDLIEERQAVISALLQLNALPAGMELFPAANDDAWSVIEKVIEECDYYLLVVGGRYGATDSPDDLSYTEREYDFAVSLKKPVMAFLHADPSSIPVKKAETTAEGGQKLANFLSKVKKAKHVKFWKNADDLPGKVALSFGHFTNHYPAVGWIRADQQASQEMLTENHNLRQRIVELEKLLDLSRTQPPPGTEDLIQGDDTDSFLVEIVGTWRGPAENGGWLTDVAVKEFATAKFTWDGVIAALGPVLLDEASENQMKRTLDAWVQNEQWEAVKAEERLLTSLEEHVDDPKRGQWKSVAIRFEDEAFGTILMQLIALGIIQQSSKKKAIHDKSAYWTLTPFGRTRAIQLRARRKADCVS